jgi:hypothetical protein
MPSGQRRELLKLATGDERRRSRENVLVGEKRPPYQRHEIDDRIGEDQGVDSGASDQAAYIPLDGQPRDAPLQIGSDATARRYRHHTRPFELR